MVRGWWSAIVLSFLSFAVVRGWWSAIVLSFAVVRGWWSAIVLSCWWSILHEFFRRTLSRSFREKSLKRKFEEHQEQQRVEDQQKEAERLQKEQEERERQQVTMVIHPYNGQQMYLTGEQRDQFFRDLAAMKPTDFKVGTTPTNPPIPPTGFPPVPPVWSNAIYGHSGCIYESWYPNDSESSTRVPVLHCPGFFASASKVNSTLKVK